MRNQNAILKRQNGTFKSNEMCTPNGVFAIVLCVLQSPHLNALVQIIDLASPSLLNGLIT